MNITRAKLHELIDQIPEERLAYLNEIFNLVMVNEGTSAPGTGINKTDLSKENLLSSSTDDIFRDQDV